MGAKIYGWQHLTFEACFLLFMVGSLLYIIKCVDRKHDVTIIKAFAILNLCLAIFCRFAIFGFHWDIKMLPDSFCSVSSFLSALCLLFAKKDSKILQFALFAGAIGGLLTNTYPDFIPKHAAFFNPETISSLMFHGGMLYLFVLTITLGYFKPTMKNWVAFPAGLCFYTIWGGLSNIYIGQDNAMYLQKPLLEGTIFNCYVVGVLMLIVYTSFIFIYEKIAAKHALKAGETTPSQSLVSEREEQVVPAV